MNIKKLNIVGLRAYETANFDFEPGMNLLVGINGVGKTTVLDALRICLSQILPEITASRNRKESFSISDIKIGSESLQVSCDFEVAGLNFSLLNYRQRESIHIKETEDIRDQTEEISDKETITPSLKEALPNASSETVQPIGIFYSTKRSLISKRDVMKSSSVGGQAAAFADALSSNREFNVRTFADWYRVQRILGLENPAAKKNLEVLKNAVYRFMPGFSDLQTVITTGGSAFTIIKSKVKLNINQLSDGERGMLSLVLDIARRLAQANPGLEDPLANGKGVILIDELDLHLHPKWQRTIVENLTRVFPNCQFIATTHSPQIIGEVQPNSITVIDNGTFKPANSYGIDSSRVLEEILDTPARNATINEMLNAVYKSIDSQNLDVAKKQLSKVIEILGPDDPEVTRSSTMITFLEDDLTDETDKEK